MASIQGLTLDIEKDGWDRSRGFIKREIPMPLLNERENSLDAISVIMKVSFAGVCGSDRGIWNRVSFKDMVHDSLKKEGKTIRILGHEFTGEVVEAGSMVKMLYDIKKGDLVSGDSHVTCGKCFQCHIGESHVCQDDKILGISIDGIFAPYVKIPAKNLWIVDPNRVRPEISAMYDPFGNAVHATTATDFRGQRVAVFGCGPIGMFSILLLRSFGAVKIIGVDISPANLEIAKALGAHETILIQQKQKKNPYDADPEVVSRMMDLTYGKGVDISMEMAGPNASLNNSIESTRRGGHVILFGLKDGDFTIPKFSRVIVKGLTLHSIIGRRIFSTWQTAQRMLSDRSNGIQDKMWSIIMKSGQGTIIPFADYAPETFEKAMNAHPKLLFKF
ncbi:MAG: alcohol dehydrogenase catalytic domain-containing protein [bacterium]|nr:alcohol dehydrogenase catalytic domain-containing protein [bacterium]